MSEEKEITNKERALDIIASVLLAIREAGEEGIPSGYLYATLMQVGIDLDAYNSIIGYLKKLGMIRESFHLLYAIRKEEKNAQ